MTDVNRKSLSWRQPPFTALLATGSTAAALIVAAVALLPPTMTPIVVPILVTIFIFTAFTITLKFRIGHTLLGEIGFIYIALAVAYTVFPAITLLLVDMNLTSDWLSESLSLLLPSARDLGIHLWRHALFIFCVALGYLIVRGKNNSRRMVRSDPGGCDAMTILSMLAIIFVSMVAIYLLSAPVLVYWDHYTRFDHLGWSSIRFIYICLTLKTGGYFVVLALLFRHYKKYRIFILVLVPCLVAYETVYSLGQRIESLTILLGVLCLYHYNVRPITLKMGLVWSLGIVILFTAIELFRVVDFNISIAQNTVAREGIKPASEFGAVYFTSFHLYAERANGAIPPRNWQLFFNDIISLIPFADHIQWNPQYWYARHYFPDAIVPPQTLGPIAESAIWGGEIDLVFRSLLNGAIFAYLVRWFFQRNDKWWATTIYAYLYATCVMTLKYSIFYQLTPLLRILVPTLLVTILIRRVIQYNQGSPSLPVH